MRMKQGVITRDPLLDWLFPELSLCSSDEERYDLLIATKHQRNRTLRRFIITALIVFPFAAAPMFISLRPHWLSSSWLGTIIGLGVATLLTLLAIVGRRDRRRAMRRWLNQSGRSIRVECAYDLRTTGRAPSRCPECGTAL